MRPGMVLGISVFFSTSQYRKYRLSPALGWLQEVRGVKTLRQNIIIPLTISQNTSPLLLWEKISDQKKQNPRLRLLKNKLLGWTD